jgi:indole-3-glycerol phosphate synthase
LEKHGLFKKLPYSLKQFLKDENKTGIIAEFKRASPSKGYKQQASVEKVTGSLCRFGASGISVLTDETFFNGTLERPCKRPKNLNPVLRKDFMIDAYQMIEAKAYGASVILLIAACLSPAEVKTLRCTAKNLGLEVLLELHDETELDHVCDGIDIVGINNRNLKTFSVDLEQSVRLAEKIDDVFFENCRKRHQQSRQHPVPEATRFRRLFDWRTFYEAKRSGCSVQGFCIPAKCRAVMKIKVCGITTVEQLVQLQEWAWIMPG